MFSRISHRYDLLNGIMSGGRHHAWRRMAARMATEGLSGPTLDVASGTGDFTFELARLPGVSSAIGVDFTREMLMVANRKSDRQRLSEQVAFTLGEAHALPFQDNQFICATVGFGIRNFADVNRALREMARVVRPGGRVVSLEIVRMEGRGPISRLFPFHFRHTIPLLGAIIAGDRQAYTYLPESVQTFLSAREMAQAMEAAGLTRVHYLKLALGTVAIHVGEKPG
ncbi:ubiquinone/menaquinone biosynthesis methyltransferase [Dehalococcoidia bacterium]|nr:ubiquinone/menaquinone biosynthesis methyltransferase [Dehalococcoidia bacterium]